MKIRYDQLYVTIILIAVFIMSVGGFVAVLGLGVTFALIMRRGGIPAPRLVGLRPYFLLMALCGVSTVVLSPFPYNPYFIGRDIYYFLSPVILMLLGFALGQNTRSVERIMWAVVVSLFAISLYQYGGFVASGAFLSANLDTRYEYGLNSGPATLLFLLLLAARKSGIGFGHPKAATVLLFISPLFLLMSLSRVDMVVAVIAVILVWGPSKITKYTVIGLVLGLMALPVVLGENGIASNSMDPTDFLIKLQGTFGEIAIRDQANMSEINQNWRGYEAFLGVDAVVRNGFPSILFGLGYGSFVEGPFIDKLNIIPIFHNGYVTFFVKGGLVGLALVLVFLKRQAFPPIRLSKQDRTKKEADIIDFLNLMASLLVLSLAFKTLATHGLLYTKPPPEILILGILHGVRYQMRRVAHEPTSQFEFATPTKYSVG